ncbi:hypothetical protein FACS1894202_08320 [Clostridia bacterium]|nr:hypothetical protein FACS1894202_08320 [Clostridia bacterium]
MIPLTPSQIKTVAAQSRTERYGRRLLLGDIELANIKREMRLRNPSFYVLAVRRYKNSQHCLVSPFIVIRSDIRSAAASDKMKLWLEYRLNGWSELEERLDGCEINKKTEVDYDDVPGKNPLSFSMRKRKRKL